jgi:hypothetical protein
MKKQVQLIAFVHVVAALALASCGGLATTGNGGSSGKGGSSGVASAGSGGSGGGGSSGSGGSSGAGGSSRSGGSVGSGGHGGSGGHKGSGGSSGRAPDAAAECVLSLSKTECRAPTPAPCWLCPLESYPNCQNTFGPCPKGVASGWTCFACDAGMGGEFTCDGTSRDLEPNPYGPRLTCSE